jgi:hypothetical protein
VGGFDKALGLEYQCVSLVTMMRLSELYGGSMTNLVQSYLFFILTLPLLGLPGEAAAQCRPADGETASTIEYLRKLVTAAGSDVENYTTRQR